MKVLIAEDTPYNQKLIRTCVVEAGHEVIMVENGQQAIDAFISESPDLVILDIVMPVKNGIEAVQEIRAITDANNDWIPIIFLSSLTESKDIARGINAGADDYLTKPVDVIVLNAKLRAMERIAEMQQLLEDANTELKLLTVKDGLTGLSNRRHFDEIMENELRRAMRSHQPVSLILCDIDYFKRYNDKYGHQAGDDCLIAAANAMTSISKRSGDLVARYGGEEFAFILPECDVKSCLVMAEKVRHTIEVLEIPHLDSDMSNYVTISCGVSSVSPKQGQDVAMVTRKLINTADQALYHAKEQGRNGIASMTFDNDL